MAYLLSQLLEGLRIVYSFQLSTLALPFRDSRLQFVHLGLRLNQARLCPVHLGSLRIDQRREILPQLLYLLVLTVQL
uniref:Putative secreted peptide n=1 Tax=Anopheles braziliensis TaxID=58242 RepID=A0A2M3ZRQ5_9DIPT